MTSDRWLAIAVVGWLSAFAVQARAQPEEHPSDELFDSAFEIDHERPESKIPSEAQKNAAPLSFGNWLLEVSELAERASKKGDHHEAIAYFRALALAVPDSSAAFRRLCDSHAALDQRERALSYCAAALGRQGARVSDYVHYVHLVLEQPQALAASQSADVEAVLSHLRSQSADQQIVTELDCLFALKLQDVTRLEACTNALRRDSPNGGLTIGYEWRLAIARLDREAAERAVQRAREHGVSAETVRSMEEATKRLMHPWEKWIRLHVRELIAALAAGVVGAVIWLALRRRGASRIRMWSFR